jgi:endonuclease-3 related protein
MSSRKQKTDEKLYRVIEKLQSDLPPDPSWPNRGWPINHCFNPRSLEILVGAVLTQNTRWERVDEALRRISDLDLTSPRKILESTDAKLYSAIRTTGFFNQKSKTLKHLCGFFLEWDFEKNPPSRDILLQIKGIGPETADTILLFGFNRPEMIGSAYSRRLLIRLGLIAGHCDYGFTKEYLETQLPEECSVYREFHAMVVQLCKTTCKPIPNCPDCILNEFCPKQGIQS